MTTQVFILKGPQLQRCQRSLHKHDPILIRKETTCLQVSFFLFCEQAKIRQAKWTAVAAAAAAPTDKQVSACVREKRERGTA